jgi:hypothetical protein
MKFLHNKSSFEERKEFDLNKSKICASQGITLIQVPYWWDRQFESIAATIYNLRPDLFREPAISKPIPANPPASSPQELTSN